jgi:hypothetical protein
LLRAAALPFAAQWQTSGKLDRSVLPIAEPRRPAYSEIDARNVKAPPRFQVTAPKGAPNVVIVLIDDMGFGVPSSFGGSVAMPTLDKLAEGGLRYNNLHTTALCSPTRAALKSGRNHHTLNMGFITEMATGMPGNTGQIPNSAAPLAEMLRLNGYSTAAFGKWLRGPGFSIPSPAPNVQGLAIGRPGAVPVPCCKFAADPVPLRDVASTRRDRRWPASWAPKLRLAESIERGVPMPHAPVVAALDRLVHATSIVSHAPCRA